ncbi:biotin transporter BioY [Phormidium sp. FACHB-592]|uniref:Biotin transporter n=1 Tax=Stenomitos frigidus AS-A4 TaxID=2933935 RepID=A0ABV0KGN4_9CYAN|nr:MULTISPECIES: biotin transporter BioY [Cyanophyceae]MBD2035695.1 biotin transporter BioY [Leptolyngbya sp. FACHB-321]MBD2078043.1 biotin transporter BioY [Phormidium sp. FACHB-592]
MAFSTELLWALIGLILTIGGTFLEAFMTTPSLGAIGYQTHSLGVTYQFGAALLVGCLGGKNAAALSQIAYIMLGLTWFPVFAQGGGLGYLKEPSFGYILGFIPGAWLCGYLAFKASAKLESLAFSCLCGLLSIHVTGMLYLAAMYGLGFVNQSGLPLQQSLMKYSLYPLPGQLAIVCAVTVLAFTLRQLMFY